MKAKTETESFVTEINTNVFFQEFTFEKNDFITHSNQEVEFADNVVWLDNIFFIYQIKDRMLKERDDSNWFRSKVIKKSVQQIKKTLDYLKNFEGISIENEKGHKINIAQAKNQTPRKIVIYSPGNEFSEDNRFVKFYESSKIGLVHLFHSEDYYWICKYLLTPAEIEEYLSFREDLFLFQGEILNQLPEQYILGHFVETLDIKTINLNYVENIKNLDKLNLDFDISFIIKNFTNSLRLTKDSEYYPIVAEIAKLNRSEMVEFKKRFIKCTEMCKKDEIILPYRVYFPRTDCGFVFAPLQKKYESNWQNALQNYTLAHKYDQKSTKCVGLVVLDAVENEERFFDMFWLFAEFEWQFNSSTEKLLRINFPFRKVETKRIENRYKEF